MHGGRRHPKPLRHIIDREVIAAIVNPDFGMKALKLGKNILGKAWWGTLSSLSCSSLDLWYLDCSGFLMFLSLANMFWKCASSSSYTRDNEPWLAELFSSSNYHRVSWATAWPLALTCWAMNCWSAEHLSTFALFNSIWVFISCWTIPISVIRLNKRLKWSITWSHLDWSSSTLLVIWSNRICVCFDGLGLEALDGAVTETGEATGLDHTSPIVCSTQQLITAAWKWGSTKEFYTGTGAP